MTKPILSYLFKDIIDIALIVIAFIINPIFGGVYLFLRIQVFMITTIARGILHNKSLVQQARMIKEEAEAIKAQTLPG